MTRQTAAPVARILFQPAVQMWQSTARAGLQLQEESTRQLADVITKLSPPQPWRKQASAIFSEAMHTAEQSLEETIRVVREGGQRQRELFQKALDAGQAETLDETQSKTCDVWTATLNVVQANTQALVQVNSRLLESWTKLGKKVAETMVGGSP
jgi:hypothetical protein